jgi:hypothetical protein
VFFELSVVRIENFRLKMPDITDLVFEIGAICGQGLGLGKQSQAAEIILSPACLQLDDATERAYAKRV